MWNKLPQLVWLLDPRVKNAVRIKNCLYCTIEREDVRIQLRLSKARFYPAFAAIANKMTAKVRDEITVFVE